MLGFSIGDSPQRSAKTDADTMLRIFARPIEASVGERELGRADGKLRITIETLQSMGRKEFLRHPVRNFRRAMRVEDRAVEAFHLANAASLGTQTVPKTVPSNAGGGDRAEPGDNCASF